MIEMNVTVTCDLCGKTSMNATAELILYERGIRIAISDDILAKNGWRRNVDRYADTERHLCPNCRGEAWEP